MLGLVLRLFNIRKFVMEKILSTFLMSKYVFSSPKCVGNACSRKHAPHQTLSSGKGSVDIFELRVSKEPRNRCYVCRNDLARSYKSREQKARGIAFRVYCASLLIKIDGLSKPVAAARTTNAIYGTLYCSCVDEF